MQKLNRTLIMLIALSLLLSVISLYGETCEPNHSMPYFTVNGVAATTEMSATHYNLMLTVGQPVYTEMTNYSDNSIAAGFWANYKKEPRPPIVRASDGDFQDMVLVDWTIEDDDTGPPVTGEEVVIYRNGYILATLPLTQTTYQDFNVFAGEYYVYGVESSNGFGVSHTEDNIGFMNPNGVITGTIKTPSGNPVIDTKVTLSPNMGRSALFTTGNEAYVYFFDNETSANRLFTGFSSNNYTIETWFRSITDDQTQTIFSAVGEASADNYIRLELNNTGKLVWTHSPSGNGNGTAITSTDKYSGFDDLDNAYWHQVACVFEDNDMTMYVDGFIVGESVAGGPIPVETEIIIGKKGPKEHSDYYLGRLDDFRIWTSAREWNDIRKYMDITLSGEEWGLAAYWKFDEIEGEIIFDLTDNDIDGSICHIERDEQSIAPVFVGALSDSVGNYAVKGIYYGGRTTFTVSPFKQTNIGRSIVLNGIDDYISFSGQRLDLTNGYTLEGWFKTPSQNDMTIFAAVDPADDSPRVKMQVNSDGTISGTHFTSEITSSDPYNDNLWHHWAITYNSSNFLLYMDGELENTIADSTSIPNLSEIVIGRESPAVSAEYFAGIIDEIRFWNDARNLEQIYGTKNQPLNGDEFGLTHYWKMNDGSDFLVTDVTDNMVTGTIITVLDDNDIWSEDIPLIEMFEHYYEPESRQATLNNSNTSVDLVDFTDISMIPISGYIRYENSTCFHEGVEILRNGASFIPPIYSDETGKWIIELEPGSTGDIIQPYYQDHSFIPPFIELPMIAFPRTGLYFSDQKNYDLTGIVAGGDCHYPITPEQSQIEVTVQAVNGCIERTVVPDLTTGSFEIADLPPFIYNISINHPDPEIDSYFIADTVSLEARDRAFNFIYHSAPEVEFTSFPETDVICEDFPMILTQPNVYGIGISMYEPYGENKCELNVYDIEVFDNISDTTYSAAYTAETPKDLVFTAKSVNMFDSGDHPYQKNIHIVVTDSLNRSANADFWAFIQGDEKMPGVNFSTSTSKMPWYVLRVPPGDGSSTYMTTEQSVTHTTSFSNTESIDEELNNTMHFGAEITTFVGAGLGAFAGVISTTETTADIGANFALSQQWTSNTELTETLTTSETYSTSGDGLITGDDATLFIGGGYTVDMGVAKFLHLKDCEVKIDTVLTVNPNGVQSTYIHSKFYIKNILMPNLLLDGSDDALQDYLYWEHILYTDSLAIATAVVSELLQIGEAGEAASNISFDAGGSLEYQYTQTETSSNTDVTTFTNMQELYLAEGFEAFGVGFDLDQTFRHTGTDEETVTDEDSESQTIGFILDDDDPGDGFAFAIKADPLWGMPVFELIGGQSSCPYEEGTIKRQDVTIDIPEPLLVDVPIDEAAVFTITISNISGSFEDQYYNLSVLAETNPGGAIVTTDGINLATGLLNVFVESGQAIQKDVSVTIGTGGYVYDNITLQIAPPCEDDIAFDLGGSPQNSDWADISVHFQVAASEVNIAVPENGFLINSATGSDTLWVTLNGYDRVAENLISIDLQYRQTVTRDEIRSFNEEILTSEIEKYNKNISDGNLYLSDEHEDGERNEWFTAFSVPIENVTEDYLIVPWNIHPSIIIDGDYELRAKTVTGGGAGHGYSPLITGKIDRAGPGVLGIPEPVDGVLGPDDQITIDFNEEINSGIIVVGNGDIALTNTVSGQRVDFTYTAGFNTITIEPAVNNEWIENQTLRVDINNVEDMYGNGISETISWEFFVNRNPLGWTTGGINDVVIYIDQTYSTTKVLRNNGGSNRSFTLIGGRSNGAPSGDPLPLPQWLVINPTSGLLTPGAEMTISIDLVDDIAAGWYQTVIYAQGVMGDEPLPIDIRVLNYPPDWDVNISDFQFSMTITAVLYTDGELSSDVYDKVGVFVDDELRGNADVIYLSFLEDLSLHAYEVFLTIYSNELTGEELDFKVWDATESIELGLITEEYTFEANASLGTPTTPVTITATNQVISRVLISDGWSWLSMNLTPTTCRLMRFFQA